MIPAWKIQAVQTLLAEGHMSQRQIAKHLQVWRGAVAGIARGTRPTCRCTDRVPGPDAVLPGRAARALPRLWRPGHHALPGLPDAGRADEPAPRCGRIVRLQRAAGTAALRDGPDPLRGDSAPV